MFWKSSGSVRVPSSSAGIPNMAGSGPGCAANSGVDRPLVAHDHDEVRHPGAEATALVGLADGLGQPRGPPSRSGRIEASGGSCATSVRTSLGMRGHERERVHGAAAAGEEVDRTEPQRLDDPMDVVRVLLGRRLAGRIGLGAALDAARVVGHDRAVREVAGERAEPARAHRRADEEQGRCGVPCARVGRRRSATAPGASRVCVVGSVIVVIVHLRWSRQSSARIASIWPTACVRPSSMPIASTCSMASRLGKWLSIDIRVRPASMGSIVTHRLAAREVVVGRPVLVREPVDEDEPARRIDLDDVPEAVRLVAARSGHVVLDVAADREVVLREGGGLGRGTPPALELARIGPQLPDARRRRVELGGQASWSGRRGPCGRR